MSTDRMYWLNILDLSFQNEKVST